MKNRILSILLALCMVLVLPSVEVYAADSNYQVITADGAVTGYEMFAAALAFAQENSGSTLKCLADVNDTDIQITKGNFTIDANGKTFISEISVGSGATVTFDGDGIFDKIVGKSIIDIYGTVNIKSGKFGMEKTDSGAEKGGIVNSPGAGTLNISGGTFYQVDNYGNGTVTGGLFRIMKVSANAKLGGGKYKVLKTRMNCELDAFIANGYGIKNNGNWADVDRTEMGNANDDDYYIEIVESPIRDFTLQLTENGDGNLTVEVKDQVISDDYLETYPNAHEELRYQYKVDNGGWTELMDSATYTFAPGSAGKHTISVITRLSFSKYEKSVDYYVIDYKSDDGEGSVPSGVKFDGEAYTLSEDTFTREGFRQLGWQDEQGNIYDLGASYTENAGMVMSPVWEEKITVEVPFTMAVDLGDNTEPGEKTFELELLGSKSGDWEPDVTIEGSVTTDGEGDYSGKLKFTGFFEDIRSLLCESALVRQVNDGAENWTYDNAVYALLFIEDASLASDMISEPDIPAFHIAIYPATEIEPGYYEFDWYGESLEEMSFKNTYTAHEYALNHDADGHWDECPCGDVQNKEAHKFGEWTETKAPTHTAKGEKERVCSVCDYVETAEIPMLEKDEPPKTDVPQTGDNSHMALWFALLLASGGAFIGTAAYGKKRKYSAK